MALQLTGAFKEDALSNLQVRLPAVVIGGGLTGVDTATELLAYYPLQVEKILDRYEALVREIGETAVRGHLDPEEQQILDEFLAHGHVVRAERARAASVGEAPDLIALVRQWGGVTLAYRKRMQDSPAYRLNHEEVAKALEEGIVFAENLDPVAAIRDDFGHVKAMAFNRKAPDGSTAPVELPARTVLVAAGTVPNITYEKEHTGTFALDSRQKFFQGFRAVKGGDGRFVLEPDANGFFTSYDVNGRFVSYYGDNHPRYNGNVVKAMASAKHGYPHVVRLFEDEIAALDPEEQPERDARWDADGFRLRRSTAGPRRARRPADANDRRGHRPRPGGGAPFPSGSVLPSAELRAVEPPRSHEWASCGAVDGRHCADGRVGGQGGGTAVPHHA